MSDIARRPHVSAGDLALLRRADPALGPVIDRVGIPPDWWADRPWADTRLGVLAFEIIGQQISVAAATAMWHRLLAELHGKLAAQGLAQLSESARERIGISHQKHAYLCGIGEALVARRLDLDRLDDVDDDEVRERLMALRGVGPWTADMMLLVALGRPDVFPAGDGGLRAALQRALALREPPSAEQAAKRAERWRPHRSAAALVIWNSGPG